MGLLIASMMMLSAFAAGMPAGLEGRWVASGGNRDAAIEELVSEMSPLKRPFARTRLRRVTKPCAELELWSAGGRLAIRCDTQPATVDLPDGAPVTWTSNSGERYSVSLEVHPNSLVQIFTSETGRRTNTYRMSGDTLNLQVTVSSRRLPRDLNYTRTFRRIRLPTTSS